MMWKKLQKKFLLDVCIACTLNIIKFSDLLDNGLRSTMVNWNEEMINTILLIACIFSKLITYKNKSLLRRKCFRINCKIYKDRVGEWRCGGGWQRCPWQRQFIFHNRRGAARQRQFIFYYPRGAVQQRQLPKKENLKNSWIYTKFSF